MQITGKSPLLRESRTGTQGLEAGTEAGVIEEDYLLACYPWLAQLSFVYSPGPSAQV